MAPFILAARKKLTENAHKSKPSSLPVEPPARLGFGEYHFPAHFNKAALYARLEFIQKIEDLAQEVLRDLAESVRPAYERLRIEIGDAELLSLNAETLRNLAKHGRNDFGSLLERLEDWIASHSHLGLVLIAFAGRRTTNPDVKAKALNLALKQYEIALTACSSEE
ncbi:MAG: hypothetical protein ACXU9O_09330, partial [Gemmatimonadaceae bacterium]